MKHQIEEIRQSLGRLEGKVDCIQADVHETKDAVHELDGRLRSVEVRSATVAGVMAAGVSGVAAMLKAGAGL